MIDTRQIFQNEQLLFQTSKLLMKYQNIKRFQNNNKKVPEYQDDFHNIKKESVVYLICALKVSRKHAFNFQRVGFSGKDGIHH